jgi:hypothetical protein
MTQIAQAVSAEIPARTTEVLPIIVKYIRLLVD